MPFFYGRNSDVNLPDGKYLLARNALLQPADARLETDFPSYFCPQQSFVGKRILILAALHQLFEESINNQSLVLLYGFFAGGFIHIPNGGLAIFKGGDESTSCFSNSSFKKSIPYFSLSHCRSSR